MGKNHIHNMSLEQSNPHAWEQIENIRERCKVIKPLVVIQCITYNHVAFLKDALDGFVMQKTDFPFVAIIHDDASTDGTISILKEYAENYPDIILPIFENDNQWSKKNGSLRLVIDEATKATGAKYIALCEGDDYWIDPLKLQKQAVFLESHPDYGLIHTNYDIANYKDSFKIQKFIRHGVPNGHVYRAMLENNFIGTLTVMYRTEFIPIIHKEIASIPRWDRLIWMTLSKHTKFHFFEDITSVYRVLKDSATHGEPKSLLIRESKGTEDVLEYFRINNFSLEDILIFYVPRSRYMLNLSYEAKDRHSIKKYGEIIIKYGVPSKKDKLYYYLSLMYFNPSLIEKLLTIYKLMNRK